MSAHHHSIKPYVFVLLGLLALTVLTYVVAQGDDLSYALSSSAVGAEAWQT